MTSQAAASPSATAQRETPAAVASSGATPSGSPVDATIPSVSTPSLRSSPNVQAEPLHVPRREPISSSKPTKMRFIPGGTVIIRGPPRCSFCPEAEREGPTRKATVKAFRIDITEVTVAQYWACMKAGVCKLECQHTYCSRPTPGVYDDFPVNYTSWEDAATYCHWVGKRLPTEEEWEYAAHGSDGRRYPWGNNREGERLCSQHALHTGACSPCSVGNFPAGASPFGLLDMFGNVFEWTIGSTCLRDGTGESCVETHPLKGEYGGCVYDPMDPDHPTLPPVRSMDTGFRCAK